MKAFGITSLSIIITIVLTAGETATHGAEIDSDNRNYPGFEILIFENPYPEMRPEFETSWEVWKK